jgi:hypothetical protein
VKQDDVSLGEELNVLVLKGKGDSIISRMKDGRVILFNRENPLFQELKPGVVVTCKISFIAQNYIIVDPVSEPNSGVDAIKLGLKMVVESDSWELSILSQAILFLIEQFEDLT